MVCSRNPAERAFAASSDLVVGRCYTLDRMYTPPLSLLHSGKWGSRPAGLSGNHGASARTTVSS
jgi:hypothetical protein